MFVKKENSIYASEIAEFLNNKLFGEDFIVKGPCSLNKPQNESFAFAKSSEYLIQRQSSLTKLILVICPMDMKYKEFALPRIFSTNPRLDFIRVVQEFFADEVQHMIHPRAIIEEGAEIGKNVGIGANTIVKSNVEIKANTIIGGNVVISGPVTIGRNCVIKDNSTIGSEGFGFEYDESHIPIHFPQIGKIIIGNNVWIGSNSTIERPAMDETLIEDNVKIDDLVQIGHNCIVGERSLIMAGSILCGGVKVGKKCWISPNVTIKEGLSVGDNALVGLGSVVIRDVPPDTVVAGNPAHLLKKKEDTISWPD